MTDAWWRRHPRVTFMLLGAAVTLLSGLVQWYWLEIANDVLGLHVTYDTRPAWLRAAMTGLAWLPLIGLIPVVIGRIRRGRVFRPLAYVGGAVGISLLSVGALVFQPVADQYTHEEPFESAAWRRNDRSDAFWPARLAMVDDVLERGILRGASRDSVERLLGPRDKTEYFRDWDLVYWLGPERDMFGIDSEWLVVRFGADGRVRDARILTD